jgi:hypothetical protein
LSQLGVGLDEIVQWDRVIDLGVVFQRVNLVVAYKPFDCLAVLLGVILVEALCVVWGEAEMLLEVVVDVLAHVLKDFVIWLR